MNDLVALVLLPVGLGLLGFIEPCSIGSSLLFVKFVEAKPAAQRIADAVAFTLVRALLIGAVGAAAAWAGALALGFQRAGWLLLGALYVALGILYLTGRAGAVMRSIGVSLGRIGERRNAALLGALFGLNIPACAAPLLAAVLGGAAAGGDALRGFAMLALFGLALSLPLALAVVWPASRRWLDWIAGWSKRAPLATGLLFVGLGLWSAWFGLFARAE